MSLERLANLVSERNRVSEEIAGIIGRPALIGHIGDYISSKIFIIELELSATAKGIDGCFIEGSLKGKSVNVKLYGKKENILDINPDHLADYYLVMTGAEGDLSSSRGKTRPLIISQVYLFNMAKLMTKLRERGVRVGLATSVRKGDWEEAMVFTEHRNSELVLSEEQFRLLRLFDNSSTSRILGYRFMKICNIEPARDESGSVYEHNPDKRYNNTKGLSLHSYGLGPFCSFRIPSNYNGSKGVYAIRINGDWMYIGKADDLGKRFNQGYGNISPRNCFDGGQQTNCRINNLILEKVKDGFLVELYFHETTDIDAIEPKLIGKVKPPWNKSIPRSSGKKTGYSGKYRKIGEYLDECSDDVVTLSYDEVEEILGFGLPDSAFEHRPWWANSGQPHSRAWTDFGWLINGVSLGEWVRFRKDGV
ncbi:MAG: GIY-YIG nuclease family protein [Candidatus Bathyarchaeota archaeon]|nr:GIY-YIG nuclease family protein [Candidatus Bathyarchaeota archaeon]